MINNIDENLISDLSYTNKDFRTIYPELLDLVKNLTDKWDPRASNESDPGVLLLKLNAIIADKNNYNIDKNILECFPLSVTQESNARKLYDLSGYAMHWYRSATADIKFQLLTENSTYTLPQWTQISNSTGDIPYTTLRALTLTSRTDLINPVTIGSVPCIQGTVFDYVINGESLITLNNLDADLRLYFDSSLIAENGIFIINSRDNQNEIWSDETLWTRVDNLAAYSAKDKVYQFGVLPNKNSCFIQFPEGLNALIDKGLKIKYVIGSGADGNVKANSIDTFTQDLKSADSSTSINSNLRIAQTVAITNGLDPETINEAYKNYKKTIGTFNTLVTIRDYENFIYDLVDSETRKNLVSNLIVSDRTNDLNYSTTIQTWLPGLSKKELIVDSSIDTPNTPELTAYDITLYLLQPAESLNYSPKIDQPFDNYNNTFLPLINQKNIISIENLISNSKAIVHNIKYPKDNTSWFTFNNLYTIKGTLVTRYKVTKNEAAEIESKVITALFNKYNSRENIFGQEIDYDDLITTIETADDRIRYIVLNKTQYDITKKLYDLQQPTPLTANDKQTILSKMILNGSCQIFEFDDNFQLEFGQNTTNGGVLPSDDNLAIKAITSESTINLTDNVEKEIPLNTTIQAYHESLINTLVFTSYVYYTSNVNVNPNEYTKLSGNDQIIIRYTENNTTKTYVLKNTIIRSTVAITNDEQEHQLLSNQSIGEYEINTTTLPVKTQYYFILNNPDNNLTLNPGDSKILQENEYFIYTNPQSTDLIILGSGTKLELASGSSPIGVTLPRISIEDNSIDKTEWPTLEANQTLNTTELTILAIGEGIKIKYAGADISINNTDIILPIDTTHTFYYGDEPTDTTLDNELEILPTGLTWHVQSRLNINANLITPQQLVSDQTFTFTYTNNVIAAPIVGDDTTPVNILFNNPVALTGGSNIDVKVLQNDGTSRYSLKAYSYESTSLPAGIVRANNNIITINNNGTTILPYNFAATSADYNSYLIPVYITKAPGETIDIYTDTSTPVNIIGTTLTAINTNLISSKSYILQIPADRSVHNNLKIQISGTSSSVQIGFINKALDYNTDELGIQNDLDCTYNDIKAKIQALDTNNIFDWTYRVPEIDKVLSPLVAESFFNLNHIYNKYTIPQIAFGEGKTSIIVSQSSIS